MNILVVTREFPPDVLGGLSYHLTHLYNELAKMNHEITVVAGARSQDVTSTEELPAVSEAITVERIPYPGVGQSHVIFLPYLRKFLRKMDLDEFDVALTHTPVPFDLGLPTVAKYHDCLREERQYFRSEISTRSKLIDTGIAPINRWIDRRSLRCADHLIFNSDLCRRQWKRYYDLETPATVIHNGVDTGTFRPRDVEQGEYVLFVGSRTERKGFSRVLEYATNASQPVRVAGTSAEHPNVVSLGRVGPDELARQYSGAIATIHPAKFEAFGNVLLESLACGTPVVATDRCGAVEVANGSCVVVTNDASKGVEEVQGLKSDSCWKIGHEHTWSRVARETMETIRDL